jgi:uncharacterized NAD-dependent epimerase/dehydratase family protein
LTARDPFAGVTLRARQDRAAAGPGLGVIEDAPAARMPLNARRGATRSSRRAFATAARRRRTASSPTATRRDGRRHRSRSRRQARARRRAVSRLRRADRRLARASAALRPTALLVGVAPPGGALPPAGAPIVQAIEAGLEIVSGLHQFLADDPSSRPPPRAAAAGIWDVRAARCALVRRQRLRRRRARRADGRQRLRRRQDDRRARTHARGARARARRAISGDRTNRHRDRGLGVPVDRTISDFTSGAVEELVVARPTPNCSSSKARAAINHPAFAAVTLGLLYGAAPDALVLVHLASRTQMEDYGTPLLAPGARLIELYEGLCAAVKPARVAGIALNTFGLDDAAARARSSARGSRRAALRRRRAQRPGRALRRDGAALRSKTLPLAMRSRGRLVRMRALVLGSAGLHARRSRRARAAASLDRCPACCASAARTSPTTSTRCSRTPDATDQVDALLFAPVFRYDPAASSCPNSRPRCRRYANGGISKDSKTIVLHFRRGVRWSDGAPLTARDLRFTWRAVMNKRNNVKPPMAGTTSRRSTCPTTIPRRPPQTARRRRARQLRRRRRQRVSAAARTSARQTALAQHAPPSTRTRSRAGRGCSRAGITARRSSSRPTRATGAVRRSCGPSVGRSFRIPIRSCRNSRPTRSIWIRASAKRSRARLASLAGVRVVSACRKLAPARDRLRAARLARRARAPRDRRSDRLGPHQRDGLPRLQRARARATSRPTRGPRRRLGSTATIRRTRGA